MSRVSNGERFAYRFLPFVGLLMGLLSNRSPADTVFLEAETMQPSSAGWAVTDNDQTQRASRTRTLWGADGRGDAVATAAVRLREAGRYRVWVRYLQVAAWRGPFELAIGAGGKRLAAKVFDCDPIPGIPDWEYTWQRRCRVARRRDHTVAGQARAEELRRLRPARGLSVADDR